MTALAGLIGAHYIAGKLYMRHREKRQRMLNANSRVFSKLPRAKQRAALYYRRGVLKNYEGIYKSGHQSQRIRGMSSRRRF